MQSPYEIKKESTVKKHMHKNIYTLHSKVKLHTATKLHTNSIKPLGYSITSVCTTIVKQQLTIMYNSIYTR